MAETKRRNPSKKQNDAVAQMSEYGHIQPQALEFEVAVLGACLIEKDAFGLVSDILKPESFYDNKHQIIYRAITQLATEDKPIVMEIPVKLTGLAEGVKAGGKLSLNVRKLKVKGLYDKLPDVLTIDVTPLAIGKSLKVADLSFDNVELISPKDVVVCSVRMTRAARSAAAEQATEE